jgi:hypothetical protein
MKRVGIHGSSLLQRGHGHAEGFGKALRDSHAALASLSRLTLGWFAGDAAVLAAHPKARRSLSGLLSYDEVTSGGF